MVRSDTHNTTTLPLTFVRFHSCARVQAAEVKEDLIRLFKEVKLYLTHKGGLDSLFRIYTLFDELWYVACPPPPSYVERVAHRRRVAVGLGLG